MFGTKLNADLQPAELVVGLSRKADTENDQVIIVMWGGSYAFWHRSMFPLSAQYQ